MIRALICGAAALSLAASAVPALAQIHGKGDCINDDPQVGSSGASAAPIMRHAHKKAVKHKAPAKTAPAKPAPAPATTPAPAPGK